MENAKIKNGVAVYTGGGIWLFYGDLENSFHFLTDDNGCTLILDESAEDFDESLYTEWQEAHKIKELEGESRILFVDELLDYLLKLPYLERGCITDEEIEHYRIFMKESF